MLSGGMERAVFVLASAAAAFAVAIGCASFGVADVSGVDASADGPPPLADGASPDPDAGPCPEPVDDGFADVSAWTVTGMGLELDQDAGNAAAPSVRVAGHAASWLSRTFAPGGCKHVRASVNLRFDLVGSGEIDQFGVYEAAGARRGVILVHHNKANPATTIAVEAPGAGGVVTSASGAWRRVSIDLDLGASKWTMSADGADVTGDLPVDWSSSPVEIRLGLPWADGTVTVPWTLHYDDVHIDFTP